MQSTTGGEKSTQKTRKNSKTSCSAVCTCLLISLSPLPQQEGGDSREEPREKDKASEDAVEEETSDGAVQLAAAVNDGGGGGGDRSDQSNPLPSSDKAEGEESSSSEIENKKEH